MSVAIVGAGPGDPGLVTVRALELVRNCEILVYDRLVASGLVSKAIGAACKIVTRASRVAKPGWRSVMFRPRWLNRRPC